MDTTPKHAACNDPTPVVAFARRAGRYVGQSVAGRWYRLGSSLCGVAMLGACAGGPPPRDNALLNDGYSLLYETVSTLRFEDDLVLLKFKTERFKVVIDDISSYSAQLKGGLERIARDYPAVRLDLQPLPEIEVARRSAAARSIALASAPIIGRSGAVFERSLLLSNAGGLDHTRHLCQVMAEAETDPNLKRFMQDAEQHFSTLYDEVVVLLDQAHFKQETSGSR